MRLIRHLPRFHKAYDEMKRLETRETLSRLEIEDIQLQRRNSVWSHAATHVPYYRNLSKARGIPSHFQSIAEFQSAVPVLFKSSVRAKPQEFLSENRHAGFWCLTGGSTGIPMRIYWENKADRLMLCAKYRFYSMWGADIFDPKAILWGHSSTFSPGWRGVIERIRTPLEDYLRNRIRLSAYRLGHDDLREYLRRISVFRPVSLYGYSTALFLLALEAEQVGFQCDSIRLLILTGEPALPDMVKKIENVFGVPAVIEYGSIECGLIANEWPDRTLRVREDLTLVETRPRGDGLFDIQVTVLGNSSFPLIRYALEDVTDAPLQSSDMGFSVMKSVTGRSNDLVVSRSGRYVHSLGIKHVLEFCEGIRRFRAHQDREGRLTVLVEPESMTNTPDTKDIRLQLKDLLEGYPIDVELVPSLPPSPAGKHRWVISDMVEHLYGSD